MDEKYWSLFYRNKNAIAEPSNFCLFVMDYFKDYGVLNILDAGCGNGRDSYYLSRKHSVVGVDSSFKPEETENCKFVMADFCSYPKNDFNLIYSRFTFHSITNDNHETFLKSISNPNTFLCIETRSDKGVDGFRYHGDDHYRNFTNMEYLKTILEANKFNILFIEENKNFAIYKDENPICIRAICQKM
jgi:tellurite methyltransferase